jgi:DNA-binding transcriptional regulator YhcF (GntR family)
MPLDPAGNDDPGPGLAGTLPKYKRVAAVIRGQIADGTLPPGAPAPSGAALARATGYSSLTCRRALRDLIADGTLAPGASRNARPRVPVASRDDQALARARRALSRALAGHRRAAGLTQPQLAGLIGLSVTTVGHAETGRTWQARPFWELADKALNADGEILRLHDAYRAAEVPASAAEGADARPRSAASPVAAIESPAATMAEAPPGQGAHPPAPVIILIVWTGGAGTAVPVTRENGRQARPVRRPETQAPGWNSREREVAGRR